MLPRDALIKDIWERIHIYFVLFPASSLPILILQVSEGQEIFIKLLLSSGGKKQEETDWPTHSGGCNKNGKAPPCLPFHSYSRSFQEGKVEDHSISAP